MSSADTLTRLFQTTESMIPVVLGDLTDEQARARPRGEGSPSIAWTVGHMLCMREYMLMQLDDAKENAWGEFQNGPASDGSDYPPVAELIEAWQAQSAGFLDAMAGLTEDQLAASAPKGWKPDQPLKELVVFLTWHEAYHIGAIGQLRKAMGLLGPAERWMQLAQEQD